VNKRENISFRKTANKLAESGRVKGTETIGSVGCDMRVWGSKPKTRGKLEKVGCGEGVSALNMCAPPGGMGKLGKLKPLHTWQAPAFVLCPLSDLVFTIYQFSIFNLPFPRTYISACVRFPSTFFTHWHFRFSPGPRIASWSAITIQRSPICDGYLLHSTRGSAIKRQLRGFDQTNENAKV